MTGGRDAPKPGSLGAGLPPDGVNGVITVRTWRVAILLVLTATAAPARGDGGSVRRSERIGGYQVTVFSAPTPFRAGPVDVSVLVQDAVTQRPIPDALVTLLVFPANEPEQQVLHPATHEAATNKLLHAAAFELPSAGWWHIDVAVEGPHGPAHTSLEIEALEPPRGAEMWLWIGLPVVPIVLFGIHQWLVRRTKVG